MAEERRDVKYKTVADSRLGREAEVSAHQTHALGCPSCGHGNADSAMFCAECGHSLHAPTTCPECNAAAKPGADICEVCGTWLLPGQCKFCSEHIGEGQEYCGTCGNPVAGIQCPGCGKRSYFDFCKTCAIPLSSQAHQLALAALEDPEQRELATLLEELHELQFEGKAASNVSMVSAAPAVVVDDQIARMRLARAALSAHSAPQYVKVQPKSLFSDQQKEHINQLGDQIIQEEERQRLEKERLRLEAERKRQEQEERRRKVQEQVNQALSRLAGKTFSSSQEARRFFMAMVSALPEEATHALNSSGRLRWRCHAYSCEHDSPAGCSAPSQGGIWLIS